MFAYIWIDSLSKLPYIGFPDGWKVNHPLLTQKESKKTRIILIDPTKDIPKDGIEEILRLNLKLYN